MRLLVDEVIDLSPLSPFLPHGRDPRLRRVIGALKAEPGDARDLDHLLCSDADDLAPMRGRSSRSIRARSALNLAPDRR